MRDSLTQIQGRVDLDQIGAGRGALSWGPCLPSASDLSSCSPPCGRRSRCRSGSPLPLRGAPLAALALLWLGGRVAILAAPAIGPLTAALIDLGFPATLIAVVARELIAGRNWRNLPMLVALALLFSGNLMVHLHALDIAYLAPDGIRLGIATLCMLIALVGGRIVPSFTRNWLAKSRPRAALPAPESAFDRLALLVTLLALAAWVLGVAPWLLVAAGMALAVRLWRWRGAGAVSEPLLFILHLGYGWLALVGAIGTMTLAVMTRATLGHTGRRFVADSATVAIYLLVTLAALLRVTSAVAGEQAVLVTSFAGLAWSGAFATFSLHYGTFLIGAQPSHEKTAADHGATR